MDSIENPWLKSLVKEFMADEAIVTAYKNAPAAKTLHHAFVGGLLDHVVSLFTVCDLAARNYPQVNRDLLLTGAFLHDIGKVHELAYQRSIAYTTKGQLLGHMIIELEMLHQKLALLPGFPDELKILIEHMIISHHGQYEFGSPKLPMFPEALMLHYLDDLDSKMESMRAQFEREAELDSAVDQLQPFAGAPAAEHEEISGEGTGCVASGRAAKAGSGGSGREFRRRNCRRHAGLTSSPTILRLRRRMAQRTAVAARSVGAQVRVAQGHAVIPGRTESRSLRTVEALMLLIDSAHARFLPLRMALLRLLRHAD